jgi:hypothetical protein
MAIPDGYNITPVSLILGEDNADNAMDSTNVVANEDGSELERLEAIKVQIASIGTQAGSVGTQVGSVGTLTASVGTAVGSVGTLTASVGTQAGSIGTLTASVGTALDNALTSIMSKLEVIDGQIGV